MSRILVWIPLILFLLFYQKLEKIRHKRRVIEDELNRQAAFFLRSKLYMDPLYKHDVPNQVKKLKEIEDRIERVKSWSERRIYRKQLKKYKKEIEEVLAKAEEDRLRSKVKSEFTKLTEVEESLDKVLKR